MTNRLDQHRGNYLPPSQHHYQSTASEKKLATYWQSNLSLLAKLIAVWFVVSFGCGIVLADWLDQFSFFGFKLGFWFAQQGAIYAFVAIIFIYSWRMKVLERRLGVDQEGSS